MIHPDTKQWTFLFLVATLLLLPWAQVKTVLFGVPLYIPEYTVLLATVTASVGWFSRNHAREPYDIPDKTSLFGLGLFILGVLLSFIINPFSLTSLGMIKSWFIFPILFGVLCWWIVKSEQYRDRLLLAWCVMLFGVAIESLWIFFFGELTYDGRLAGAYPSPNFLAYFLAPAPLVAGYLWLRVRASNRYSWRALLFLGYLLCTLSVLFLTRSYGVWLALFVAACFLIGGLLFRSAHFVRKNSAVALFLPIIILVTFFSFEWQSEKWQALVQHDDRSSLSSRMMIWRAAGAILADHPLLGIGVGRFQTIYLEYQPLFPPYLEWAVPEPHNFWLALWLTGGLLGFVGFIVFFGRLLFLLFRTLIESPVRSTTTLLFLSLWVLFFVYGLGDTPYFKSDLAYSFYVLWALSLREALPYKDTPV